MTILIVGNLLKDVYLNLDSRTENFEQDKRGTKWLNLAFNASEHHFFNRSPNLGGAAVSLEVLSKLGLTAIVNGSDLKFTEDGLTSNQPAETYRYILLADDKPCYLVPTDRLATAFSVPTESYDYLYIDRSAKLSEKEARQIITYLDISPKTKLILYLSTQDDPALTSLLSRADLVFAEDAHINNPLVSELSTTPPSQNSTDAASPFSNLNPTKIIHLSDQRFSYQDITEPIMPNRTDMLTHLSFYSIAAATILGSFILGKSVEESFRLARLNIENAKLNSTLTLSELQELTTSSPVNNTELIAKNLVLPPKGILAADESGGSIHKKFNQLHIPDTYDNRRDYRNLFFTTENIDQYINGVILFDETARQTADDGQTFTAYLTSKRIIPGIKVDQGLAPLKPGSLETVTKGLDSLDSRLSEYYQMGLRFAKWRAAFEIRLNTQGDFLTPTDTAITENCQILAEYARKCQQHDIVPIVEPEVVYDGYYDITKSAEVTAKILDCLFEALNNTGVNLHACILKVNMILAGKQYPDQSTPEEVGSKTAEVLKNHAPDNLAGVVFLSGGQTPEQATSNLAEILKHSPFPWPVTFSFARALQDPALYAWAGNNQNADAARSAFLERLKANKDAIEEQDK